VWDPVHGGSAPQGHLQYQSYVWICTLAYYIGSGGT
jgi:hypothetical protein